MGGREYEREIGVIGGGREREKREGKRKITFSLLFRQKQCKGFLEAWSRPLNIS